mmetsp:Transcript_70007/g.130889  ORF Transcript_70007/g.130889 Transcript_70007/m.130889 type:complete len:115 (+) Transcript_70007:62-406(+)
MSNHWVFNQGSTTVLQFPEVSEPLVDTALHDAARTGCASACEIMVARGAKVNARSKDGYTPLHLAAAAGHLEVIKVLLTARSDVLAKDAQGATALDIAKQNDLQPAVSLLSAAV